MYIVISVHLAHVEQIRVLVDLTRVKARVNGAHKKGARRPNSKAAE
jgi:hypothetical protein